MKKFIEVPKGLTFDQVEEFIRQEVAKKIKIFFCNEDGTLPHATTKNILVVLDSVVAGNHIQFAKKSFAADTSKEIIVKAIQKCAIAARQKNGHHIFLEMEAY